MQIHTFLQQKKAQVDHEHQHDVELLLCHVLAYSRVTLYQNMDRVLPLATIEAFEVLFQRYLKKEPLQYILGYAYFFGLSFFVAPGVLIPRFDSEVLVEAVLKQESKTPLRLIDLGTGSGNLAITLKKMRPEWDVYALDNDAAALALAKKNAEHHGVTIHWIQQDMIEHMQHHHYDVVISNPPYIAFDDSNVEKGVKAYEPHQALFAKEKGLFYYRRLLKIAAKRAMILYVEVGHTQAESVHLLAPQIPFETYADIQGYKRVVRFDSR